MMLSSLAAMVLAAAPTPTPWQTDYGKAYTLAADAHKPLAVVLAQGKEALTRVVGESDAARQLTANYVCVYVDTTTPAGQKLATAFEMSEGLVISGQNGAKQALRHEGTVPAADLAQYVVTYADGAKPVASTAVGGVVAAPVYAPAPVYYGNFGGGGGCANGRCGR